MTKEGALRRLAFRQGTLNRMTELDAPEILLANQRRMVIE